MPGTLSFVGHLCCSCFEKITFFSISREDERFFLKKIFIFSKKLLPTFDGGREGHFSKILLNKDEEKIFNKFAQQDQENFFEILIPSR